MLPHEQWGATDGLSQSCFAHLSSIPCICSDLFDSSSLLRLTLDCCSLLLGHFIYLQQPLWDLVKFGCCVCFLSDSSVPSTGPTIWRAFITVANKHVYRHIHLMFSTLLIFWFKKSHYGWVPSGPDPCSSFFSVLFQFFVCFVLN